jgi:hypothetical protein
MNCARCGYELLATESHEQVGQTGARQHPLERCFELVEGERNVLRSVLTEANEMKDQALDTLKRVNDPELSQKLDAALSENEELKKQLAATTEAEDARLQAIANENAVKPPEAPLGNVEAAAAAIVDGQDTKPADAPQS